MKKLLTITGALVPILIQWGCGAQVEFSGRSLDNLQAKVIADQEFPASLIGDMETTYNPQFGTVTDQISLKEKPLLKSKLNQVTREKVSELFLQGHDGDVNNQEFDISAAGKLDLLLIIDNSGSMGEEQAELSENLKALTKHMDNVDWQIGVLTTDQCQLQNALHASEPFRKLDADVNTNFEQTIKGLGTSGSRDEMGIKMAMLHLGGQCLTGTNAWMRRDAVLAVFFVTDEQNECDADCKDEKGVAWGPAELVALMNSLRRPSELKAYALLWNRDVAGKGSHNPLCRRDAGVETYGSRYSTVVQAFGGIERSICLDNSPVTNDYEPVLEVVSKDVSRVVRNEFEVKVDPIPGTMKVKIDGNVSTDITITGRKIQLKNARGDQGKLMVEYRTGAVQRFDKLVLASQFAKETLQVLVNDAEEKQYSVDGKSLAFSLMPPDRAQVKVNYRKNAPLRTGFKLSEFAAENKVKNIYIGGVLTTGWTYNAEKQLIEFLSPPIDGVEIEFEFLEKSPKITAYDLPVERAEPRRYEVYDAKTLDPVAYVFDKHQILLSDDDVSEGRKIVIAYNYGDHTDVYSQELAQDPLEDSVVIKATGGSKSCIDELKVSGRTLSYSCDGAQLGEVIVQYKYVVERYRNFKMAKELPVEATYQVFVDRLAVKDFTFKDGVISVPDRYLQINSKVRVIASILDSVPVGADPERQKSSTQPAP